MFETSDAGSETSIYSQPMSDSPAFLAWSPDGKRIALAAFGFPDRPFGAVDMFNLETHQLEPFARSDDLLPFELVWSPDGRYLFLVYILKTKSSMAAAHEQLGVLSYPGGGLQTITSDVIAYHSISVSSDGSTLASVQATGKYVYSLFPAAGGEGDGVAVPNLSNTNRGGFTWLASGDLLMSESGRIIRISPDGSNRSTVLVDDSAFVKELDVCGAAGELAFAWLFHGSDKGFRIYRAKPDGSDVAPVAPSQTGVLLWGCPAKSDRVYYTSFEKPNEVYAVPIMGGGEPQRVAGLDGEGYVAAVAFSPDGGTMATVERVGGGRVAMNTRIVFTNLAAAGGAAPGNVPGAANPRPVEIDPSLDFSFFSTGPTNSNNFHYTPDGKALGFVRIQDGIDNVWTMALDGGSPKQLTHFPAGRITDFSWSPNGKTLIVGRSLTQSDVVLLRDTSGTAK